MNEFPLTPFFIVLEASGIRVTLDDYRRILRALQARGPWTISRLRAVLLALLVQHSEQEAIFLHQFDSFFNPSLQSRVLSAYELDLIWQDLRALAKVSQVRSAPVPLPVRPISNGKPRRPAKQESGFLVRWHRNKLLYYGTIIIFLWVALGTTILYLRQRRSQPGPLETVNAPSPSPTHENTVNQNEPRTTITVVSSTPFRTPDAPIPAKYGWKYWMGIVGGALLLALAYGALQWRGVRHAANKPSWWNPDAPSHFPLSRIGGKRAPCLDSSILDQLADSLSYFQSREPSKMLNLRASVEATARHSGLPQLIFRKRTELRTVYVLEDLFAEALAWNPISQELAEGLTNRGIHVTYGKFEGSPAGFRMDDGHVVLLQDLDDDRDDYLVLMFSDGKGLHPRRDAFILEELRHWPFVAWMELREPRFWDESTFFVAQYGLPIYPASASGLFNALQRFLTEQGAEREANLNSNEWQGVPVNTGTNQAVYVESLLGDALLWAQACAMIQPITLALADALRLTFQPHLPFQRIERLFYLPGTTNSVSGLRFSVPVLAILRSGFTCRWDQQKQKQVLDFLLQRIGELEPDRKDSLAHFSWRYVKARVYLEAEPDAALEEISKLEQTPLGNTIRSDLKNVVLAGEPLNEPGSVHITRVPLRRKPNKRRTLNYLASLNPKGFARNYLTGPMVRRRPRVSLRGPVSQRWRKRKPSPALRLTLSSLTAWVLFSLLLTPYGSLVIVGSILFVRLSFICIDRLSATLDPSALQKQLGQVLRAAFFVSSWDAAVPPPQTGPLRIVAALILLSVIIVSMVAGIFLGGTRTAESYRGMAYVPGGEFLMGSNGGDQFENPAHRITVKPFYMDITEVTCEAYDQFVKATGNKRPVSWINGTYPPGYARRPVTGVDWYDANSYAQWVGKRLPTEEEWEFAARGTDARKYAWGNEWRANSANTEESSPGQVVDVGSYPEGKSPFGLLDMIGNAWEWTASDLKAYPGGQLPSHPSGEYKIIRGGSWREDKDHATVTYRGYSSASGANDYSSTGFRCVAVVDSAAQK